MQAVIHKSQPWGDNMKLRRTWLLPMCGFIALAGGAALTGCKKKTEGHARFSPGRTVAYNNMPAGHSRKGSLAIPPP